MMLQVAINTPIYWVVISALLGSPIITTTMLFFFNKKKNVAEVEGIVGKNYHDLLDSYKQERDYIQSELKQFRSQQLEYLKNSNLLLSENQTLRLEMKQIKGYHDECNDKNATLLKNLTEVQQLLKKHNLL